MKNKIKGHLNILDQLGIKVVEIKHGGKHPKLVLEGPDKKRVQYTVATSLGDNKRGLLNFKADVRRTFGLRDSGKD